MIWGLRPGGSSCAGVPLTDHRQRRYDQALKDLTPLVGRSGDDLTPQNLQQLAWMLANLRLLTAADTQESAMAHALTVGACAYDSEYFYYIPFDVLNKDNPQNKIPRIARVARSDWNADLTRLQWTETPKANSTPVALPTIPTQEAP